MLKKLTIELTGRQAHGLRELIEGFYAYQVRLGEGEGSLRTEVAEALLEILPPAPKTITGTITIPAGFNNDEIPF